MFLLDWYEKYLEIKANNLSRRNELTKEVKEVEFCQSCETLREQLSLERITNSKLMDRLLTVPEKVVDSPPQMVTRPTVGRHMPWRVRQEMLQTEDRERAKLMRDAPKASTEELEKELDIASAERAAEAEKR